MGEIEETLGEKIRRLELAVEGSQKVKTTKRFRMPIRGKVTKSRLKNGYATVLVIGENDSCSFTREQIQDSTVKIGDTFHHAEGDNCLSYKGKPLLIIPKKSNKPYNPNQVDNTTFSQKHIMSRMMNETLDTKKKLGMGAISIGAIILIAVVAYAFIAG